MLSPSQPLFVRVQDRNGVTTTVPRSNYTPEQLGKMKRRVNGVYLLPATFTEVGVGTEQKKFRERGSDARQLTASDIPSRMALSDFSPLISSDHLDGKAQLLVRNAMNGAARMKLLFEDKVGLISNTAKFVGALLGLNERTVLRIAKKSDDELLRQVGKGKKKRTFKSRKQKDAAAVENLPEGIAEGLCVQVAEWWKDEVNFTLKQVQEWMQEEFDHCCSTATIGKVLRGLSFSYKISVYNPLINGKAEIISWKARYIPAIRDLRTSGFAIYYFDETWVHSGFNGKYAWNPLETSPYAIARRGCVEDVVTGPAKQVTKGQRAIVMAMQAEDGILDGSIEVLISGVKPANQTLDYHKECNSDVIEKYMTRVIPLVEQHAARQGRRAAIVLDNASYHSRALTKLPTSASPKSELKKFLEDRAITVTNQKRPELLSMVKTCITQLGGRKAITQYWLDEFAEKNKVRILRLPPYHCTLNPIELVWGQMKAHLRSIGKSSDKLALVRDRAIAWLKAYSPQASKSTIEHVIATEELIAKELADKTARVAAAVSSSSSDSTSCSDSDD